MLLLSGRSILLVVDVQERLAPAISESERVVDRIAVLLRAARELDVPALATEQYSKGLGSTVASLAALLPPDGVVEKIHFNAALEPGFVVRLRGLDRTQIVVTGTEAHVCVLQTVLGLKAAGFDCFLVADAVGSRDPKKPPFRHGADARQRG